MRLQCGWVGRGYDASGGCKFTLQTVPSAANVAVSSEYGNTPLLSEKKYQHVALISISD